MTQYQSFPDAAGASRTLDKLKALMLPDLGGLRFLDIGCNEGFFCGFAAHRGARESVGIDHSPLFIGRARQRFPDCTFHVQGWEELPDGPFDVILIASALHYADDQPALLHRAAERLSVDGVLVLETGIVSSPRSDFVKVQRGIDERFFPTMPKMREVLASYAWKWMGPSVSQDGDPIGRHVFHIRRRRPLVALLLQPPGFGKSTIATSLFPDGGPPVVSTDRLLDRVVKGQVLADDRLREAIEANYTPYGIDRTTQALFAAGFAPQLLSLWMAQGGGGDFVLEGYVPSEHHAAVRQGFIDAGYLPVTLDWQLQGPRLLPSDVLAAQGEAFYRSLVGQDAGATGLREPVGFVDELRFEGGRLAVRGWAIDVRGELPGQFAVRLDDRTLVPASLEKMLRVDVQRHLGLAHGLVGYRFVVEVPGVRDLAQLKGRVQVFAAEGGRPVGRALQFAASVAALA
jgi:SAM-dependent methyltransferase